MEKKKELRKQEESSRNLLPQTNNDLYGGSVEFLKKFNPSAQTDLCINKDNCFFGEYPTLSQVGKNYGKNIPVAWLVPQLLNLSEFCGCKEKLQGNTLKECAEIINMNYHYLKVSEFMLFFHRFKSGKYGRFYGSVDPLVIMTALREFLIERADAISKKEMEKRNSDREVYEAKAVTYKEYQEGKDKS